MVPQVAMLDPAPVSHVYIMMNCVNGTLHIGVSGDLANRIHLHRIGRGCEFCAKWGESYPTMLEAIAREKAMKKGSAPGNRG